MSQKIKKKNSKDCTFETNKNPSSRHFGTVKVIYKHDFKVRKSGGIVNSAVCAGTLTFSQDYYLDFTAFKVPIDVENPSSRYFGETDWTLATGDITVGIDFAVT